MKQLLFCAIGLLCLLSSHPLFAQSCDCNFQQTIVSGSYWNSYNEFNCYQYVKAYYKGHHYGTWIPPQTNNINNNHSSGTIANDPSFVVVNDPAQAGAVLYPCGHAAVVLPSGCLVEKVGWGSELRKHGINNGSCGLPVGVTYYKYTGRSPYGIDTDCLPDPPDPPQLNCPVSCTISGTVNGSTLNSVNFVSNYYNSISLSCSQADHFEWTNPSGSAVYYACGTSDCSSYYIYLNSGQSISFNVVAKDECDNTITSRSLAFVRSSGGYYYLEGQDPTFAQGQADLSSGDSRMFVSPNPATDQIQLRWQQVGARQLVIRSITGQIVYQTALRNPYERQANISLPVLANGVYTVSILNQNQQLMQSERIIIQQ